MKRNQLIFLIQIFIIFGLLVIWQVLGENFEKFYFVLGTPETILKEFWLLNINESFYRHFLVTGSEAVLGLIIGTTVGSLCGLLLWYSDLVSRVAKPFILAIGTLPVFAFAPLMIIWFGIGFEMKIAMATFSTIFVAFNQANKGAMSVSEGYIDKLKGMDANRNQIFLKVIIPGSIDWVLSSMRLNVGFSLLGAFIGEFIAAESGLGYIILRAGGLYNIPRAFAAAIGITILALLLDFLARYIEKHRFKLVQLISVPNSIW